MSQPVVVLKQILPYTWQLITPKGHVLVDDLQFASQYKAELWVKAYISSFSNWKYEILPLTRRVKC